MAVVLHFLPTGGVEDSSACSPQDRSDAAPDRSPVDSSSDCPPPHMVSPTAASLESSLTLVTDPTRSTPIPSPRPVSIRSRPASRRNPSQPVTASHTESPVGGGAHGSAGRCFQPRRLVRTRHSDRPSRRLTAAPIGRRHQFPYALRPFFYGIFTNRCAASRPPNRRCPAGAHLPSVLQ